MNVDFENITEVARWFDSHLFAPYYGKLGSIRNPIWLRLGAPLVGIGDGLVSAAQAAAGLGEAISKGVTNCFRGAANRDSRLLKKGLLQIGLGGGSIALFSIPIVAMRTLRITALMAYDPASAISVQRQKLPACRPAPIFSPMSMRHRGSHLFPTVDATSRTPSFPQCRCDIGDPFHQSRV